VRHGGVVVRVVYLAVCFMEGSRFIMIHLTVDGRFTDLDIVER